MLTPKSPAPTLSRPAALLPPLYAIWMDELLGSPIPPETEAACHDCAMCRSATADGAGAAVFFDPSVKCCTYQPELPNFLVGAILGDDAVVATGRATVETRIRTGALVFPLGLGRPDSYDRLYDLSAKAAFGRDQTLRCPHFLDEGAGTCGIWPRRNAVCATWFCKHERGAVGLAFWQRLRQLLSTVEHDLAWWCARQVDIGTAAYDALVGYTVRQQQGQREDETDSAARRALWGRWAGREQAFYQACAGRVEPLSWVDVAEICGPDVRRLARRTRRAFARLTSPRVPNSLRTNTFEVIWADSARTRVRAYSPLDLLDLPTSLVRALRHFDGRPTGQALCRIREHDGLEIDDDALCQLVDFRILIGCRREAGSPQPAPAQQGGSQWQRRKPQRTCRRASGR